MHEVFVPVPTEGFELCHPTREEDFETLNLALDGTPRSRTWRSPPMRLIRDDAGEALAESDAPWLGTHALIFRPHVLRSLEPMLRSHGELLPVTCSEASLVFFNATRVVDALDEPASSLVRFADGRIMTVVRYAFRPEVLASVDIFKVPSLRVSPTFVSARFVEEAKAAALRGLEFQRVWSSGDAVSSGP
jgi:hypothetical protein